MTADAIGHQGEDRATGPSLKPQLIGQAENALRALLDRTLAGTGLAYRHWIALSLAVGNDEPVAQDALIERITGVLKVDGTAARDGRRRHVRSFEIRRRRARVFGRSGDPFSTPKGRLRFLHPATGRMTGMPYRRSCRRWHL